MAGGKPRLRGLAPPDLTAEQQAVYDAINEGPRGPGHVSEDGSLSGPFNAMLYNPVVGGPLQGLGAAIRYHGVLPDAARELAILTVAADHHAEFEWYHHSAIALRLGVEPETLETIRTGGRPGLDDELQQTVVDVVRSILAHEELDDAAYARAAGVLGAPGLVELTTLVGYYGILAFQMHLFRVPLPEGAPLAWPPSE